MLYTIEINGIEVYQDNDYDRAYRHYDSLKTQTRGEIVLKHDGGTIVRRPALDKK